MGHHDSARRDADITSRLPKRLRPSSFVRKTHAGGASSKCLRLTCIWRDICMRIVAWGNMNALVSARLKKKKWRNEGSQKVKKRRLLVARGYFWLPLYVFWLWCCCVMSPCWCSMFKDGCVCAFVCLCWGSVSTDGCRNGGLSEDRETFRGGVSREDPLMNRAWQS